MKKYIDQDGLLNIKAITTLAKEIEKAAEASTINTVRPWKLDKVYFSPKFIPVYDEEKRDKNAQAFDRKRNIAIKNRSKLPVLGSRLKMTVLLKDYKNMGDYEQEFRTEVDKILAAFERHNAKVEKFVTKYKEQNTAAKEKLSKEFDKNLDVVKSLLKDAGIKSGAIAINEASTGKTMIIKLSNGGYVQIGKSDKEKFEKVADASLEPVSVKKKKRG